VAKAIVVEFLGPSRRADELRSRPMLVHARFERVFSAAHRVWNDAGKCSRIHGHNYRATIDVHTTGVDEQGFTIPFDAIKEIIDAMDHRLILDRADPLLSNDVVLRDNPPALDELIGDVYAVPGVPSTEFLAHWIAEAVWERTPEPIRQKVEVVLQETDSISARATAMWPNGTR
jgi:6-pyruvoyltetrahydropterin/6-carboxytetrahydropterin synthase